MRYGVPLSALVGVAAAIAACSVDRRFGDPLEPPDDRGMPAVAALVLSPDTASLGVGETRQFTASPRDAGGGALENRAVSWISSVPAVASVTQTGLVTGLEAGRTTIRATSEGQSDSALVIVRIAPDTSGGGGGSGGGGSGGGGGLDTMRVGFFVTPTGSSSGDGSRTRPWDLATALAGGGGRVRPGDTIWLRGGLYRGRFRSTLGGTAGLPVVVRQFPGERAIIDGATGSGSVLRVSGPWSVFWGFEITNSDPVRSGSTTRPNVIYNQASHTRYVNLVIHDGGVAFYTDPEFVDVEIAGCVIYNNGRQGPDRGHGHGLYLKSNTGPVRAYDNVIFNQFGYGIHVYSNAGSGELNNILLEGNVTFNNGTLATNSSANNILVGGDDEADDDVVRANVAYFSPGIADANVRVGYGALENGSVELRDNYVVGGSPVLDVGYWSASAVRGNTFVGTSGLITLRDPVTSGHIWTLNTHRRDPASSAWRYNGSSYTFSGWRAATGLAAGDQAVTGSPAAPWVAVRPNLYEPGRGTIVIVNWGRQASVPVSLTPVLALGARYEIRNVQDLFGAPVASGTFDGAPVTLPMTGVAPPVPVGYTSSPAPRTGPDFDVFLVLPR